MPRFNYNEKTVLLTGAGGAAPPAMIDCLRNYGYRILAADMCQSSPAFYQADKAFIIPPGTSPEFLPAMQRICEMEKVDAVVSVVDEELESCLDLEKQGVTVIQPQKEFVRLCLNKYHLMHELRDKGINAPKTWRGAEVPEDVDYPLFIKPCTGRGSRGIGSVKNKTELLNFLQNSHYEPSELIVQELIHGKEYTVSVVVWRDGNVQAVVPKEIISKVGITRFAVTRKNEKIDKLCRDIQAKFHANGPFNVQLIIDEKTGEPYPFEINPRFSTSITLTMAAGVDELGGLISQALFGSSNDQIQNWREGVVLVRRTLDTFLEEKEFRAFPIVTI